MPLNAELWNQIKQHERGLAQDGPDSLLCVVVDLDSAGACERIEKCLEDWGGACNAHINGKRLNVQVPVCRLPELAFLPGVSQLCQDKEQRGWRRSKGMWLAAGVSAALLMVALIWVVFNLEIYPPAPKPPDPPISNDPGNYDPGNTGIHVASRGDEVRQNADEEAEPGEQQLAMGPKPVAKAAPRKKPPAPAAVNPAPVAGMKAETAEVPAPKARVSTVTRPKMEPKVMADLPPQTPHGVTLPVKRRAEKAKAAQSAKSAVQAAAKAPAQPEFPALKRRTPKSKPLTAPKAERSSSQASEKAQKLYDQGVMAYKAGNLKVAVRLLSQAVKLQPKNIAARFSLGWAHFQQSDYAEAAEQFQEILKINPKNSEAQSALELAQRAISRLGEGHSQK
jgi:TolA-binding protein